MGIDSTEGGGGKKKKGQEGEARKIEIDDENNTKQTMWEWERRECAYLCVRE